jgi:hypothetical protein
MNRTIEAIPTTYKGVQFRSRLEARWAVFFDFVGIKWQYEPRVLDVSWDSVYIPDFWLPHPIEDFAAEGWGFWMEVKPTVELAEGLSLTKLMDVCKSTKHNGLVFIGRPLPGEYEVWKITVGNEPDKSKYGQIYLFTKGMVFAHKGQNLYSLENAAGFGSHPFFVCNPYDAYGIAMGYQFEEPTE